MTHIMANNKIMTILALLLLSCSSKALAMTDDIPTAYPQMEVYEVETETWSEVSEYSGSAPLQARFTSNVENLGGYTALYEWQVYKSGETSPYLVRYDADFEYEFREAGTSRITLQISFVQGTDTIVYEMSNDDPPEFTIDVSTSSLSVPNAFSPNGDGVNDIFRVKKDGYQSIIEFKGYIFSRNGRKLFEWSDITQGWDGTYGGSDVADGVYYVRIDAKGADGKVYKIRQAVNLLRGYSSSYGSDSSE